MVPVKNIEEIENYYMSMLCLASWRSCSLYPCHILIVWLITMTGLSYCLRPQTPPAPPFSALARLQASDVDTCLIDRKRTLGLSSFLSVLSNGGSRARAFLTKWYSISSVDKLYVLNCKAKVLKSSLYFCCYLITVSFLARLKKLKK